MSEKPDTIDPGERASELTVASGPVDSGHATGSKSTKGSRRPSSSSERQFKVERAQKCLENAALVSKRIKEHRRATAELLGKTFDDDDTLETASEVASVSTRTGYSVATTDSGPPISVEDALNIPGISDTLANTLKQKEILMERIKQYKEISKKERPVVTKPAKKIASPLITQTLQEEQVPSKLDFNKLQNTLKEKENALSLMQVKMKAMETTIHDLQEKISEKDSLIEAKNKATFLMSDNLSKKEKDSINLLEDTRQQMIKMQENFVAMETEWKSEKEKLLNEIELKNEKIKNLEEANSILENSRFEISLAHSKLSEKIETKTKLITDLEEKLSNLVVETSKPKDDIEEEKGSQEISNMVELTKKLELLEQLNCQMKMTNLELENKLATLTTQRSKTPETSSKKSSPQVTRKRGKSATRNAPTKMKSPWTALAESTSQDIKEKSSKQPEDHSETIETIIQCLNKELLEKEYSLSEKEALIKDQLEIISQKETIIKSLSSNKSDSVDAVVVCNLTESKHEQESLPAESKKDSEIFEDIGELQKQLIEAQDQIAALNLELESANKNMLKVKSAHKLKLKQMQKTIDNFSKMSDSNAEVTRLSEEVNKLTQKIAELEEDKGNLQLHLVDYDSGRLNESEFNRKLVQLESLAETRLKSIADLETQKFDLVQELHVLQQKNSELEDKLTDLQQLYSEHVSTEIKCVQLEEQLDKAGDGRKELELMIDNLKLENEQLNQALKDVQEKNAELSSKLDIYIQENIELVDRLEKLSAGKVSSAESIEIVESLTVQEKLELEEYNKSMKSTEDHGSAPSGIVSGSSEVDDLKKVDIGKNLLKLSQESEELNKKIELFTQERHEVMEKMSQQKSDNERLRKELESTEEFRKTLESQLDSLSIEKKELLQAYNELLGQFENLKMEYAEKITQKKISEEASVEGESPLKESVENIPPETGNSEEKPQLSKTKNVKQLTKDILKLKNIIKEREAEIADCQMKILSLEEQHQKLSELAKNFTSMEHTIKLITDEKNTLKDELSKLKTEIESNSDNKVIESLTKRNEELQISINDLNTKLLAIQSERGEELTEFNQRVSDYQQRIETLNNLLEDKENEISEYLNKISQLNNVSQKLKSTVELLEEEKFNGQNVDTVKQLNIQLTNLQKVINEQDNRIKYLEDEKNNLLKNKSDLLERNTSLENDIQKLYNTLLEKDIRMKDLQDLKNRHDEEISKITIKCSEKDEEIHEIKLELRKESIENENLRKSNSELSTLYSNSLSEIETLKTDFHNFEQKNSELSENITALETKNKELMEKLKKFAANLKRKSNLCIELENEVKELKLEHEKKSEVIEEYNNKIVLLNKELECSTSRSTSYDVNKMQELEIQVLTLLQEKSSLAEQLKDLENNYISSKNEIENLLLNNASLTNELQNQKYESMQIHADMNILQNKLQEYQQNILTNNSNSNNNITILEQDVNRKQEQIINLLADIEKIQDEYNTFKFGQEAKIQERDLFIENLESEISNYRSRISRLEESISIMEDRRHSLERKADQLGSQLEEKQKSYRQYSSQEDELVNRLAVLMEHDQVVEKRLKEIEKENLELNNKLQSLFEDNKYLRDSLTQNQEEFLKLKEQSHQTHLEELELSKHNIAKLEHQIKEMSLDHQTLIRKQQEDIQNLESEFNSQIENNLKEKKNLMEKYEKEKELKEQIEIELQQHIDHVRTLSTNLQELHVMNLDLQNRTPDVQLQNTNDYTEQYISEINKLQAIINENNNTILSLHKIKSDLETKITYLEAELTNHKQTLIERHNQIESINFDMKTTKEEVEYYKRYADELKKYNEDLETKLKETEKRQDAVQSETVRKDDVFMTMSEAQSYPVSEEIIVPKKAYLCYDKSTEPSTGENKQHILPEDPFNSEEGWGLGEKSVEYDEVKDENAFSKIQILMKENEQLKIDLQGVNTKLTKAMKKLRELKINNEKLTNELKFANQQSSLLDNTIEDELKMQIESLEKEIQAMSSDLTKERREKDAINKQNEILKNANDRFLEMKEKLENDVILWKFKCKEITDKVSSLEWGEEKTEGTTEQVIGQMQSKSNDDLKALLEQVEKENDDLNIMIDELKKENMRLSTQNSQQIEELNILRNELSNLKPDNDLKSTLEKTKSENVKLNAIIEELQQCKTDISEFNSKQKEEIDALSNQLLSLKTNFDQQSTSLKEREDDLHSLNEILQIANREIDHLKLLLADLTSQNQNLRDNNESLNDKYNKLNIIAEDYKTECVTLRDGNLALEKEFIQLRESITQYSQGEEKESNKELISLEESNRNLKIDLEKSLSEIEELKKELLTAKDQATIFETKAKETEEKLAQLNLENDQLLSTVTELRTSISSAVDQRGYEVAEMWKQHLAQRESDFSTIERELRDQINSLESKYENLLDNVQSSSQEETNKMIVEEQLASIQNKLKDKEEHLINLQNQYSDIVSQMQMLRAEIDDEKVMNENKLLNQQEEYEKQLTSARNKEIEKDAVINELKLKLKNSEEDNEVTRRELNDLQILVDSLRSNITDLTCQLHHKENEISSKMQDVNTMLNQRNEELNNLQLKLSEYEKKIENLAFEKESELAVLRLKLQEQTTEYQFNESKLQSANRELVDALNSKIEECDALNRQISDLNKTLQEDSDRMSEMKTALESQELEIVTLKDEMDKLQILLESSTARISKHVTFAEDTKLGQEVASDQDVSSESTEMVPKPELDLALYMLYQRNIRCEELTMELSSLLEERDTLQLRLSDTLRTHEELRQKLEASGVESGEAKTKPVDQQLENVSETPTTSRASIGEAELLKTKLSELRSVRHSRDVSLRHDSERRELDMQLLQRDVSRLPPEAADRLRQAHYTLSRDSQSASSVILNWLMGKGTPKNVQNL